MSEWAAVPAFVVAGVAAMWPMLARVAAGLRRPATGFDRADWVNRLFSLAAAADESGDTSVATAARSLISALVSTEPAKRGK